MHSAMDIACTLLAQDQQVMKMHTWLTNVLEDLQWHDECLGFVLKFGNSADAIHVLDAAYRKKIKVFAPLDGGTEFAFLLVVLHWVLELTQGLGVEDVAFGVLDFALSAFHVELQAQLVQQQHEHVCVDVVSCSLELHKLLQL